MFKKIALSVLLVSSFAVAQESEMSLEDKYNVCSENYEQCLVKCEESSENSQECGEKCEDLFYQCNEKVDQDLEKGDQEPAEENSSNN